MKKLVIIAVLAFAALPAFSQEDEYAKFQGVWYGEREDENTYFIFENNTAIMFDSSNGGVFFVTLRYLLIKLYSISNEYLSL
jgi:hypothetical protein